MSSSRKPRLQQDSHLASSFGFRPRLRTLGLIQVLIALSLPSTVAHANADQIQEAALETLSVSISRVQLSGALERVGLDQTGSLAPPADPHLAGWYEGGSTPSGVGRTVIVGSVDFKGETGVFWELRHAIVGDLIVIRSKSDSVHSIKTFVVTEVTLYRKSDFPTARLYANLSYPGVALVTDGGPNESNTAYLGNLVVYGQLQSKVLLY